MPRLFFALLLCLLALTLPAVAAPLQLPADAQTLRLGPHLEVLEDPSGRLNLADLQQPDVARRFAPLPHAGDPNFGFTASAWWLRLSVLPEAATASDWRLEVAFPTLDAVDFYPPGNAPAIRSGDRRPFADRPIQHRNFVFPLHLEGRAAGPQVIHLRVASTGSLTAPLTLWSVPALHASDQASYGLHALYYGMLLALGLYNLLLWFSLRDRAYLAYVVFVMAMALGQLALSGLGFQYLWSDSLLWQSLSLNSGFAAAGLFGAIFTRSFLDTRRHLPQLDRLLRALALAFALTAVAPLLIDYRPAAIATSLIGIAFSAVAVYCGLRCLRRGDPGARFFLLAWLILLVGVALMGLRNFAWLPTNFLTANGIQIGSAIEVLLLSFALADRIQHLRRDKAAAQEAALRSERARIAALEDSERVLEARVGERTAELEDANRRLLAREAQLREQAHHDPLTGLANRVLLFDRLEQARHRGSRDGSGFAVLLIDLDDFKQVNDTLGHEAGDAVLRVCGERLRQAVRAVDTVCRLGGDELVVLFEGAGSPGDVRLFSGKIAQALQQPIAVKGSTVLVSASIGAAFWPNDAQTPEELLHAADQAMYRSKRRGRGGVELAGADC